jgi:hypothetical protein
VSRRGESIYAVVSTVVAITASAIPAAVYTAEETEISAVVVGVAAEVESEVGGRKRQGRKGGFFLQHTIIDPFFTLRTCPLPYLDADYN